MGENSENYEIPSFDEIMECSHMQALEWDPILNFRRNCNKTQQSYEEQKVVISHTVAAIDQYIDCSTQCTYVKGIVIAGSPGSGKSFLLNYTDMYAMTKGLKVAVTALMAQRAVHLGGVHIHKLFYLPVNKRLNLHRMAETALQSLMKKPVSLNILKMVDVLFLD